LPRHERGRERKVSRLWQYRTAAMNVVSVVGFFFFFGVGTVALVGSAIAIGGVAAAAGVCARYWLLRACHRRAAERYRKLALWAVPRAVWLAVDDGLARRPLAAALRHQSALVSDNIRADLDAWAILVRALTGRDLLRRGATNALTVATAAEACWVIALAAKHDPESAVGALPPEMVVYVCEFVHAAAAHVGDAGEHRSGA